jgi:transcriptional regulator with XRE-family HTH domain
LYGSYIRAARERAGLSVADAAKAIKKGADLIYRIERDAADASMDTLDKLAEAYGCLAGDLLPNSGAGGLSDEFEPLLAALRGLSEEETRDQINLLATQARAYRIALMRRVTTLRDVGIPARPAVSGNVTPQASEADSSELDYEPVGMPTRQRPPSETVNARNRPAASSVKAKGIRE